MLTRASLLWCILWCTLSILATTSASEEYIWFQFEYYCKKFSGTGVLSDDESSDNSWFTVWRLLNEGSPMQLMNIYNATNPFTHDNIHSARIATRKTPNGKFREWAVEWTDVNIVQFYMTPGGGDFKFLYKHKEEEICLYKMKLDGTIFIHTGTLIASKARTPYFIPNPNQNNGEYFQRLLKHAQPKDLAETEICECNYEESSDSSTPNCPEGSSRWLPIAVQSISSHRATRIYFNIVLKFNAVTLDGRDQGKGSLKVARMDADDNSKRFVLPFRWTGRISLVIPAQEECDIIALSRSPNYEVSVNIANDWYQIEAIMANNADEVEASYLTTLKPKIVKKTYLMVRNGSSLTMYYSSVKEETVSDSTILTMEGSKMSIFQYERSTRKTYKLTTKSPDVCADDIPNAAITEQTISYGVRYENEILNWAPIHITRVEVAKNDESTTLEYKVPEVIDVLYEVLTKNEKSEIIKTISGSVKVQRLESMEKKFSAAAAPAGWNGHLFLTQFTKENRNVDINEHLQSEANVRIQVKNHWWQLRRIEYLCWDSLSTFVATIVFKYSRSWVFMLRYNNINYFGRVPIDKISDDGKLCVPITHLQIMDTTKQLLTEIEKKDSQPSPLKNATEIQEAAIAIQEYECDSIQVNHFFWKPIHAVKLVANGIDEGSSVIVEFLKHKELEVRVLTKGEILSGQKDPTSTQKVRIATILSFDCTVVALTADQLEADKSKREVVLEFDVYPGRDITDLQGETTKCQLYLTETSDIALSALRRFVITSAYMGSNFMFLGTLESTKILFWIQPSDENLRYVIGGTIDEIHGKISIVYNAKVQEIDLTCAQPTLEESINEVKWKNYIKDKKTRSKHNFGMHRTWKKFTEESCVNLHIEKTNLNILTEILQKPILIDYSIKRE